MPVFQIGLDDGRSLRIEADDQEAALAGVQHFQDSEKPSGTLAGLGHGMSGVASGISSTLGLGGVKSDGLDAIASAAEPKDYKAAPIIREGGHWYNPSDYNLGNIPQALAEQSPGLAADLTAGKVGAKVGSKVGGVRGAVVGGIGGSLGSMLLRTFGPGAHENADARTGTPNSDVTGPDMAREGVKQAITAPLNALGAAKLLGIGGKVAGVGTEGAGNALKKYLSTVGAEAAAGGARDVTNQVGSTIGTDKGVQYDPNKTAEAAIASGAGSGLLVAPRLAADVTSATKFRKFGGDNAEAAAALANRQLEAADGKKLVGPLGGTKTAAEAVNAAHSDVHTELAAASKNEDLSTDNANTLKRINAGGTASNAELNSLATEASPDTVHLARQAMLSKQLKGMGEITDKKFTGGISGMMEDKLRALYNPTAAVASTAAAAAGLPAMIGLSPHIVAGTYGAYAGARALDKLTGARSPAQGFTDKFGDTSVPVRAPAAPVPEPVEPDAPQPTLRATLNSNAKVEEGMAKIAKQLSDQKRKAMISEALPAITALAKTRQPVTTEEPAPAPAAPEAPNLSPVAMKMLGIRLKAGLPAPAPEPTQAPAPEAPQPQISPVALTMLKQKLKQGLPSAPASPQIAQAMQAVAAHSEPALAPVISQISKKSGEDVQTQQAPSEQQPYTPIPEQSLYRKHMTDDEMVDHEFATYAPSKKKAYGEKSVKTREGNREDTLGATEDHSAEDRSVANALYHQLDHTHTPSDARKALAYYTAQMSPEAAAAVNAKFTPEVIAHRWKHKKT
jgi:hypothetical protein